MPVVVSGLLEEFGGGIALNIGRDVVELLPSLRRGLLLEGSPSFDGRCNRGGTNCLRIIS